MELVACPIGGGPAFVAVGLSSAAAASSTASSFHGTRTRVVPITAAAAAGRRVSALPGALPRRATPRQVSGVAGLRADADYYQTLGVSRSASQEDIKRSFRKLARKYHPDVNKEASAKAKFQELSTAYEVLSNPEVRQRYDQFGEAGVKSGGGGGGPGFATDFGGSFSDLFETFFGGGGGGGTRGRSATGPQVGDDLRLDVEIPFAKAVFGGEYKLRFSHLESCGTCKGSGVKPGSSSRTCGTCRGQGSVMQVARTPMGAFQQVTQCPTCNGLGEEVDEYCGSCGGKGTTQVTKQLVVNIPAGVDSGSRLRVRGEGDAGTRGGPPGDLYVVLRVAQSSDFKREGVNTYASAKVSYLDAILGRKLTVKTVDGPVELAVAPGTQPGAVLKIEGKGVPKLGNKTARGDHFVTVEVTIPKRLSSDERELLRELDMIANGTDRSSSSDGGAGAGSPKKKNKDGLFGFARKK
ncbi:hypothetical protein MMPV_006555 [Pyropia vietnamensis]